MSVQAAHARAVTLASVPWRPPPPSGRRFARHVALGDPQASLVRVLEVLAHHALLGDDGMLRPDVSLLSIGDHFDWDGDLAEVSEDGRRLLRWLAEHPPDQVRILVGNHDAARVMELAHESDASMAAARSLAHAIARIEAEGGSADVERARFSLEHPRIPTPSIARRDYGSFTESQRALVEQLLVAGRLQLAQAATLTDGRALLLTHAGVTSRELAILGAPDERDPARIAALLEKSLHEATRAVAPLWSRGERAALVLEPLYVAGTTGHEAGGLLYHRPARPDREGADRDWENDPRAPRRYDPRALPRDLLQACGHAGHKKSLDELRGWHTPSALTRVRGGLRTLRTSDEPPGAIYEMGIHPIVRGQGGIYMIDSEMAHVPVEEYPLFEVAGWH